MVKRMTVAIHVELAMRRFERDDVMTMDYRYHTYLSCIVREHVVDNGDTSNLVICIYLYSRSASFQFSANGRHSRLVCFVFIDPTIM
jgi:hypothetical protein